MPKLFENRVVLITGAASGIGRASASAFAREGAQVVVADIDADGGEETVALVRDAGGEATFVQVDVSVPEQVHEMVARTVETYGGLDAAINNAGSDGGGNGAVEEFPVEAWVGLSPSISPASFTPCRPRSPR